MVGVSGRSSFRRCASTAMGCSPFALSVGPLTDPGTELPSGWSPGGDQMLTVWECVQHTARVLAAPDGGAEAAAWRARGSAVIAARARR